MQYFNFIKLQLQIWIKTTTICTSLNKELHRAEYAKGRAREKKSVCGKLINFMLSVWLFNFVF